MGSVYHQSSTKLILYVSPVLRIIYEINVGLPACNTSWTCRWDTSVPSETLSTFKSAVLHSRRPISLMQ